MKKSRTPDVTPRQQFHALADYLGPSPTDQPNIKTPPGLIGWTYAIFLLAHGAAGVIDWRRAQVAEQRDKQFKLVSERLDRYLLVDHQLGGERRLRAATRLQRLLRQQEGAAARAEQRVQLLALWQKNYDRAAQLLRHLGIAGQLLDAVVLGPDGALRTVRREAWQNERNWQTLSANKIMEAGDIPLSPLGTPLLPGQLITNWFEILERHQCQSLDEAGRLLLGSRRPEESWKEFLLRHGVVGSISNIRAAELARLANPSADGAELRKIARVLGQTARRMVPP